MCVWFCAGLHDNPIQFYTACGKFHTEIFVVTNNTLSTMFVASGSSTWLCVKILWSGQINTVQLDILSL